MKWVLIFWVCNTLVYDEVGELTCAGRERFPEQMFEELDDCSDTLYDISTSYLGSGRAHYGYCQEIEGPQQAGETQ